MSESLYFALCFSTISSKSSQLIFGSLQKHAADSCKQIAIELMLLSFVLAMHVGIILKQNDSLFTEKQTCCLHLIGCIKKAESCFNPSNILGDNVYLIQDQPTFCFWRQINIKKYFQGCFQYILSLTLVLCRLK